MGISISILGQKISSADLCFAPTTSAVLKDVAKESFDAGEALKEHPSLLNNELQPLINKYIELKEPEFREKAVAFIKTALYVAIVAGLVMSAFFATSPLLPLGLLVAWFALQIWIAYDVMKKVEETESKFPFTGPLFLLSLSVAPLWEVYTRKTRIEEALSTALSIKLKEACEFLEEGEKERYISRIYPKHKKNNAAADLFKLELICYRLNKAIKKQGLKEGIFPSYLIEISIESSKDEDDLVEGSRAREDETGRSHLDQRSRLDKILGDAFVLSSQETVFPFKEKSDLELNEEDLQELFAIGISPYEGGI